jgi:hypothetical protein
MRCAAVLEIQMLEEPHMRITLLIGSAASAGLLSVAPAAAMPAFGIGEVAKSQALVEKVEFKRRPDGSIYYVRPRFDDRGPYFFAYRGYAYPYNPGYTYRLTRGELRPSDRLRRYKIVD